MLFPDGFRFLWKVLLSALGACLLCASSAADEAGKIDWRNIRTGTETRAKTMLISLTS